MSDEELRITSAPLSLMPPPRGPAFPLGRSFRAGWGPGGTLVFGSHSVVIASLPALDLVCNGDDAVVASAARIDNSMRVRASSPGLNPAAAGALGADGLATGDDLERNVAAYIHIVAKSAANGGHGAAAATRELRLWKMVATALSQLRQVGEVDEAAKQRRERQKEAMSAW